jgi:hypothetical protein
VSRDRDPFDRAVDQLRDLLKAGAVLQGRPLAINLVAQAVGVSQTPVREALAWLAGEGLIIRTHVGYVGRTFEASSLAELYRLNLGYVIAAFSPDAPKPAGEGAWSTLAGQDPHAVFEEAVVQSGDRTLLAALRRAREALAPFAVEEVHVLGDGAATMAALVAAYPRRDSLRAVARGYFRRRIRASGQILQAACERLQI